MTTSVLIVEDDDAFRACLCEVVEALGFAVRSVRLAAEALDVLRSYQPAVIMLDLVMPRGEMSGIDFLFVLRSNPAWTSIPVIVISGIADLFDRETAERLNVYSTLQKPLSLDEVTDKLTHLVGNLPSS